MIIELLLDAIYNILSLLFVFKLPALPADVTGYIENIFDYMVTGAGILANYTPLGYLMILFGVILAIDAGLVIYNLVMWIIRKIPMLGIS